ncbi:M56 family metallopeptidase [Tenacibaculum insulae]|uniref:M56 family metallopeptidase n=1 Tax=Tenacibaculum insulae TaxID=2029677 RepID=UPI003AB57783
MITYLIKSTLCLTLFLAFYHLVLEREKMHRFNRFYLLSAVFVSFLAPLYTIYIKVIQEPITVFTQLPDENITFTQEVVATETPINYWNYAIYFSVVISAILLVRFIKNLYAIYKKVSISDKFKHQNATIVLIADEILPHTFWNYIFINKATYESKEVEQELFTHELTHVAQKHTFDVLFVELLKVIFWFNPIFYFLKKSVQLNHEFLADTKVVTQHKNVSKYQHLLINTSAWSNEYALASNLHYLVTKKRIIMMTKQTSKAVILLKKVAVLPLVIGAFFLFAERVEAQESVETIVENVPFNSVKTDDSELYKKYVHRNGFIVIKDEKGKKVKKKYNELNEEEKRRLPPPPPLNSKEKTPSKELIESLKNSKKYALWIDGKVVKNEVLNNYKASDFSNYSVSFVYKNARSKRFPQKHQASLSTKKYFKVQNKKRKEDFLNYLKNQYKVEEITIKETPKKKYIDAPVKRKSSKQSIASEQVIDDIRLKLENVNALKLSIINNDTILPPPPPKRTSTKIVRKGEKSNIPPPPSPVIKKGEVSNIPPPPPAIKNKTEKKGWVYLNNQTIYYVKKDGKTQYYNRWGKSVDEHGKELKPIIKIDKIKNLSNREISELKYETTKKNVTYYLNNKEISKKGLNKLDPKTIDKMKVIKNKDGSGSIYITTKK